MITKRKVWLDTDPGSDIDDAVCLAYLLSHSSCDLLGVSTVTGMPEVRASIADAICSQYERRIAIHAGCGEPWIRETHQKDVPHAECLPNWSHRSDFPPGTAISAMRDAIHASPGEVELLAIGALTNVGTLFVTHPETASMLRGLTIMGGRFTLGIPVVSPTEHNIACDPHAAARVFRTRIPKVHVVGLDVTLQVVQTKEEIRQSFEGQPIFAPVMDMASSWFKTATLLCYHDIVAAVSIFEPEIVDFSRGEVSVEASGSLAAYTHFRLDPAGPHLVAHAVRRDAFLDHFCSVTGCSRV